MMSTKKNIFLKFINDMFTLSNYIEEGRDITEVDLENIVESSDKCLQFFQESEIILNNDNNQELKQILIDFFIYHPEKHSWGPSVFHNNKITLPTNDLDKYLVKYFKCLLFKQLMPYVFQHYKIKTHKILICLLEGTKYPDLIMIDKSINYQDMDWEELQELTHKNNQYGFPLVYLSSGFVFPDDQNIVENLDKLLTRVEVFSKIYDSSANHIIVLTKKNIQFYTFNIRETRKLYDIRESYLENKTRQEIIEIGRFILGKSFSVLETIELLPEKNGLYFVYSNIPPEMSPKTQMFIYLLQNKQQQAKIEYLKNNYYQINETLIENENYVKKALQNVKNLMALGEALRNPVEDRTSPELKQGIKTLVKQSQQEIPLLHQTKFNLREQLFIIFIYHLIQEIYPEQTVKIENINVEEKEHFIEVQYNNKNIIIFIIRYGTEQELLQYIFLYGKTVFIREVLFIMEKEIIWIKEKEIERLTRCVKTEIKINKKVNGEWKQGQIKEQEEEFYEKMGEMQLKIIAAGIKPNKRGE